MPDVPAIHRYEIPVDDAWHTLDLPDAILHVAARRADTVELWALTGAPTRPRTFRVYGTGETIPDAGRLAHRGTALAPHGLVWHLMERHP